VTVQSRPGKLTRIDDETVFAAARCGACGQLLGDVSVPQAGEQYFMPLPKWRKDPDGVWRLPRNARKFRDYGNRLVYRPLSSRERGGRGVRIPSLGIPPERIPPMPRVKCEQCRAMNEIDPSKWDWATMATDQRISTKRP
jgi:phage FluMu protein Com